MSKLSNITKSVVISTLSLSLVLSGVVSVHTIGQISNIYAQATKFTICHATSSRSNPYTRIVVDDNSFKGHFDNPGTTSAGHEDDLLFEGEVECPETTANPTPTPTASIEPSPTPSTDPTPSPTPSVDPSPTPTPTPTTTPTSTPTPTPTSTPSTNNNDNNTSSSSSNQTSSTQSRGQILSAIDYADSGVADELAFNLIGLTGSFATGLGSLLKLKKLLS